MRNFGTFLIGVAGTIFAKVSSLSLTEWGQLAAIAAGIGTASWMAVQIALAILRHLRDGRGKN